jgi:hypothetical protein
MLLRRFTDFVLQSRLRMMGIAFAVSFLPLVGTIGILMAAFVTLCRGMKEGFLILVAATLPLIIEAISTPASQASISSIDLTLMMVVCNIVTWLFAGVLRKYANWSLILQLAAFLSIGFVLTIHLVYPDVRSWWQTNLTEYMLTTMQAVSELTPAELIGQKASINRLVETLSPFATGLLAISVVFYALLQTLLARWWQAYMYNPSGLRKELYAIRLSYIAGIVFLVSVGLSITGNEAVVDMMSIVYLTFALAGLSIVHTLIARSKSSWFWIGLIYVAAVLMPLTLALVALMAVLDTFFNIRNQLKKRQV